MRANSFPSRTGESLIYRDRIYLGMHYANPLGPFTYLSSNNARFLLTALDTAFMFLEQAKTSEGDIAKRNVATAQRFHDTVTDFRARLDVTHAQWAELDAGLVKLRGALAAAEKQF
jgi:hypothetical protein